MKTGRHEDPLEVARLMKRKTRLRDRMARLLPPARALASL
jgi:hypothetical protein